MVSSARTDEVLKVIVANPTMIKAYKAGVPGNGQPFPDGSKIVKLQWKPKKSTEATFVVDVPDVFTQAFVIEKDSKRFPKSGGWGYALFNYEAASDKFTADPSRLRLRTRVPCGSEGEGPHLPPVPEALNRACPRHEVPRGLLLRGYQSDCSARDRRSTWPRTRTVPYAATFTSLAAFSISAATASGLDT